MRMFCEPASVDELRQLIAFDPETGELCWKVRPSHFFKTALARKKWNAKLAGKPALTTLTSGYKRGRILGVPVLAHRVVWALHHGEWPLSDIDHINHKRTDNRIINLRVCSRQENCRNKTRNKNNTSGVTGVGFSQSKNAWHAYIKRDYQLICLGHFSSMKRAIAARKNAESQMGFHVNHGQHP